MPSAAGKISAQLLTIAHHFSYKPMCWFHSSLLSYLLNHWTMMLFCFTKYHFVLCFALSWMNYYAYHSSLDFWMCTESIAKSFFMNHSCYINPRNNISNCALYTKEFHHLIRFVISLTTKSLSNLKTNKIDWPILTSLKMQIWALSFTLLN